MIEILLLFCPHYKKVRVIELQRDWKWFELANVRVIRGFELSGVFLYENSAQCSRGMQNQFDLVKVRVIRGFELSGGVFV